MKKTISIAIILNVLCGLVHASQEYSRLNSENTCALSVGFSMSQTHHTANTVHPEEISKSLVIGARQANNPYDWLMKHQGYVLKSLPIFECRTCGYQLQPSQLDCKQDASIIANIIWNISTNLNNQNEITLTTGCPLCRQTILNPIEKKELELTQKHQNALVTQIANLGAFTQAAYTNHNLPTCRISLEIADILQNDTRKIDPEKLQQQSAFLKQFNNPLLFCHHYANPQNYSNLFQNEESIEWFANCCAEITKNNPNVTHICPISQPIGYSFHLARATLPPFACSVDQKTHLAIIKQAQIEASKAMKSVNPNIKVLISHQWKQFKTAHGPFHPLYYLEILCSAIANRMYNGAFISMLQDCQNDFDGIALSLYPGITFNGTKPEGNNCAAYFNEDDAYQSIIATHKAFPNKEIFIVETGCNTADPEQKKAFIDMTLRVCQRAQKIGVKISGIYFWGVTNDPDFYFEWGMPAGSTNFGPYDRLNPDNPCDSINASGLYLRTILKP